MGPDDRDGTHARESRDPRRDAAPRSHAPRSDIAVANVATLESLAADTIAPHRFGALLLGVFAAAALLLAGIGVYGVMNYVVAQRSHEIGVRLALGARPRDAFRLVLGRGLLLTAIGATLGRPARWPSAR